MGEAAAKDTARAKAKRVLQQVDSIRRANMR